MDTKTKDNVESRLRNMCHDLVRKTEVDLRKEKDNLKKELIVFDNGEIKITDWMSNDIKDKRDVFSSISFYSWSIDDYCPSGNYDHRLCRFDRELDPNHPDDEEEIREDIINTEGDDVFFKIFRYMNSEK